MDTTDAPDTTDEFEFICIHKDTDPSDLNEVFKSHGCSTLEAKAPIVNKDLVEKVMTISPEQQRYATMAFKSESGHKAVDGRLTRTSNRPLTMIEINGETIISAGEARERSPVSREELDKEMEEYNKEKQLKLKRKPAIVSKFSLPKVIVPKVSVSKVSVSKVKYEDPGPDESELKDKLNQELDEYMKKAERLRLNISRLEQQNEREMMDQFENEYQMPQDLDFGD